MQTHGLQKLDQSNNIIKIFMSLGHILSHTGFSVVQNSKISLEIGCFFPRKRKQTDHVKLHEPWYPEEFRQLDENYATSLINTCK